MSFFPIFFQNHGDFDEKTIFILQFFNFRSKTQVNCKIIITNLILPKYLTLYIIYKKLLTTHRKKQNNPLGDRDHQVENHWSRLTCLPSNYKIAVSAIDNLSRWVAANAPPAKAKFLLQKLSTPFAMGIPQCFKQRKSHQDPGLHKFADQRFPI